MAPVFTNLLNGYLPQVPVTAGIDQGTANEVNNWILEIIIAVFVLMVIAFVFHRLNN